VKGAGYGSVESQKRTVNGNHSPDSTHQFLPKPHRRLRTRLSAARQIISVIHGTIV
jgi:hypothetical protein